MIAQKIKKLLKHKNVSAYMLGQELKKKGYCHTNIYRYLTCKRYPERSILKIIAHYFDLPVSYFDDETD
jgi:hypothetical protein